MFKLYCNGWAKKFCLYCVLTVFPWAFVGSSAHAQPSLKKATVDSCLAHWERKWGVLKELRPSRLVGLREVQMSDGNVIFIDKLCEHVVIGEVVSRSDNVVTTQKPRLDRANIQFNKLISVGPAQIQSSWVFMLRYADWDRFKEEMKDHPEWGRAGYYVGLAKEPTKSLDSIPCHFAKLDLVVGTNLFECSGIFEVESLAGLTLPFAINPEGLRIDLSGAMKLPKWSKK
jgi:hypothetical protein